MEIEELKKSRQQLITLTNPEWAYIVNLRNLVRHEFATQGWLTIQTLDTVLDWKLRQQRKRTERHRASNTPDLIRELTGTFWRIKHPDPETELRIKLDILSAIPGTGIGVSSALLTLTFPEDYAIIDFRNWKILYGEDKKQFTKTEYKRYLETVVGLAKVLGCDTQEIDYLLWKEFEKLA
ncbi:MAG: hypothetical protein ACXW01_09165 [Methylobacter sp.]